MAEFLNMPYGDIVVAAAVPSILFYLALLLQVDCHAAIHNLKGQPKEDIPDMWETLKDGWFYLFSLALLIYLAVNGDVQRRDTLATLFWPDTDQSRARASLRMYS